LIRYSNHLMVADSTGATRYDLGDYMRLKNGDVVQLLEIYAVQELISVRYLDGSSAVVDMREIYSKLEVSTFKQQLKELL